MVAIRRCPSSCRCRMARAIPDLLSEITNSVAGPDELDVDADAGQVGAHQPADLGVLGIDVHEHDAGDVVVAGALEVGVVAVAVAGPLAGEEQQVVAAGADRVLEPDEHLVEERVAEGSGWPSPVSRKTPIRCERWVTRLRAAAAGV